MTYLEIRYLTPEDSAASVDRVATVIARPFSRLEVAEWLVPDPTERERILTGQFGMYVDAALEQGQVLVGSCTSAGSSEVHAAAVWFSEVAGPHSLPDDYDERLAEICGDHLDRFIILDEAFALHHPTTYPHYCLTHLATLPERQGHGLGTELLRHTHRQLDSIAEVPAFLIASNARTRDLYMRHGYEPLGVPLQLPDGPRMWPMWREPQPVADNTSPERTAAPAEAGS